MYPHNLKGVPHRFLIHYKGNKEIFTIEKGVGTKPKSHDPALPATVQLRTPQNGHRVPARKMQQPESENLRKQVSPPHVGGCFK